MSNYQTEIKFLNKTYKSTLKVVKSNEDCVSYANEKIRHSMQVVGAGNHIIKHEKNFQNKSEDFIFCAKIAYILHDIGRFAEIEKIYHLYEEDSSYSLNKSPLDHGVKGAEILSNIAEYNDPRIVLPVRHHGHLSEQFYNDKDYIAIKDDKLKKEIEQILFLVMDADKIANFYMLKREFDNHIKAWAPSTDEKFIYGSINPKMKDCYKNKYLFPRPEIKSNADDFLATISWIFDINYKTSIDFCKKHKLAEAIMKIVARYNDEFELQKELLNLVNKYLEDNSLQNTF